MTPRACDNGDMCYESSSIMPLMGMLVRNGEFHYPNSYIIMGIQCHLHPLSLLISCDQHFSKNHKSEVKGVTAQCGG